VLHRLRGRAFNYLEAGKYAEAARAFDQVLAGAPRDAGAFFGRALALARSGRRSEAAESLREAIAAGFTEIGHLVRDPALAGLRGEPAYDAVLSEYGPVIEEQRAPSLATITRLLAESRFQPFMPRLLPRHRSPDLTPATLALLDSPTVALQCAAIVGLTHQNANAAPVRARVAGLLASATARVRNAAAEYLVWHGTTAERQALIEATQTEPDAFTLASERAALELIAARGDWAGLTATPAGQPSLPPGTTCANALALLRTSPTTETFHQVGDAYRFRWETEPKLAFRGMSVDKAALDEHQACFNLTATIFRFFGRPPAGGGKPAVVPLATSFTAPVRDYFDPAGRNFGIQTGSGGPFARSVHVGEDLGTDVDDTTVVSIGDGIVRHVSHTYSWGFIVVVEHRLAGGGSYCSLYAHLGPSITVAPGQLVRKGQRIGALGRSSTWENGGYASHLHFGLHRGPYLQTRPAVDEGVMAGDDERRTTPTPDAKWVTGYVSPRRWAAGNHGWIDPHAFIVKRLSPSVP
jgi:murein DD-endopeptidase MepM/ murein hydrolase activator NlpD